MTWRRESFVIKDLCRRGGLPSWEESPESQVGVHYLFPTRVGNSGKRGNLSLADRHDADRVARAALEDAVGIDEVDQRLSPGIPEAGDLSGLEDQRGALAEDLVRAPELVELGDIDRADLAAGDRGFARVLGQADGALDAAGAGVAHVAGDARHVG